MTRALALCLLLAGCMPSQKHAMARTTRIADLRFSDEYTDASHLALTASSNWTEYDQAMEPWETGYDAMRVLISTTLTLDVARNRREFRAAGCRWYRALEVVDATSPVTLPSVEAGLASRWRRRCGKQ